MKNPTHRLPAGDFGANTLRNYSYQSTYGVVLLCSAVAGKSDYRAIWCEQEDDLLAEISDTLFDSYQVKTRTPELGYWDISFAGFISAVKVFLHIEKHYPEAIRYYNFVCDAHPLESEEKTRAHKCPQKLIDEIRASTTPDKLSKLAQKGLSLIAKKVRCDINDLWPVLRRLRVSPEPIRKEAAIEVLMATHLPLVPCCSKAGQTKLRRVAVDAISQLDEASRLASPAPERHYACLDPKGGSNPQLLGKRVTVEEFVRRCNDTVQPGFRYVPHMKDSLAVKANPDAQRFYTKLERGNLDHQADTLRARSFAAESTLLDLATRPDGADDVHHLKTLVKAECDDALAIAIQDPEPFGPKMYADVIRRLEDIAKNEPTKALRQPKEVLIGIAGLLTEECKVWWSKPFEIRASPK